MPFIDHKESYDIQNCKNPEHNPPTMIVLKPGTHTYQCPKCGHIQNIIINRNI